LPESYGSGKIIKRRFDMEEKKKGYTAAKKSPGKYPNELKREAIEMFGRSRSDFRTRSECARHIADLLGIGTEETVMNWVSRAEIDGGVKEGVTTDEREEIRRLKREVAELRRANGILRAASAFFAAEPDRPQNKQRSSVIYSVPIVKETA
jgi:transposase